MEYKLSFYNIVTLDKGDSKYIWNTKKGSIVELESEVWDSLCAGDFENERVREYADALYKEGIIVNKDLNELEQIVFRAKQKQFAVGQKSFGMVIAPTMACNYNCPYCFEGAAKEQCAVMSQQVMDAIVKAWRFKLEGTLGIEEARITWFGGEPLLTYDRVIVPLQTRLVELCREKNIAFGASIITNGYFLTEEKYDFLFGSGVVKFVQITIDGTEKEYCKRKGTTAEAYHRVINNILNLSKYCTDNKLKTKINIRVNIDKSNYEDIKRVVDYLRQDDRYGKNIVYTPARLRDYDFCKELDSYCTTDEYERLQYDFEDYVEKPPRIIEPKTTFCGQHCMNVFCVGANGDLYKCEHDFGIKEHAVGNISTGLTYNKYFADFMYQPLPEKCNTCVILPVCMGGCPHRRLMTGQNFECEHTVENMKRSVNRYILSKK